MYNRLYLAFLNSEQGEKLAPHKLNVNFLLVSLSDEDEASTDAPDDITFTPSPLSDIINIDERAIDLQ